MEDEYLTEEETTRVFNAITANGNREMCEVRFHQAVNELAHIYHHRLMKGLLDAMDGVLPEYHKDLVQEQIDQDRIF